MSFQFRHGAVLLCTVICLLKLCSTGFPRLSIATDNDDSSLLKYEVNNIYVGKLKHTIQIHNEASVKIHGGQLIVPIIRNETARHYVNLHNISSSVSPTIISDSSENIYACWDHLTIDRYQTFVVELSYFVVSFGIDYVVSSSSIDDYNVSSELYQKYTQPEPLIESNNVAIVSLAQTLTSNTDGHHGKVQKIYEFVRGHLDYQAQSEERGALWALEERVGDCSEYSYLFVALCRAIGIPARVQAGFAFHTYFETLEDGHMWAEYYLENYEWIPVDVTWQMFDGIDDRHFSSIRSTPEVVSYANYVFDYVSGPEKEKLKDSEIISLTSSSTDAAEDDFVETVVKTVSRIKQARSTIFLGKIFGTALIFASEVKEVDLRFLQSEVELQNTIDCWVEHPESADSYILGAFEKAEESLQNALMLITKVFTIFVSVLMSILLIILLVFKLRLIKEENVESQ